MNAIEFENVTFYYAEGEEFALKNVDFSVKEGEFVAVLGRNGSGKSTLARLCNRLLVPKEGKISVFGMTGEKDEAEIRKTVGIVFQNPDNQTVASVVEDDIAFGPENLGVPRKEIGERIEFALNAVGMKEYAKASPTRLSGGQKQRVAIAGVLALKPEILVLDESTAMLDPQGRKEILSVAEKLNKERGVTIITVTHYMDEAAKADRIIVLSDGKIVKEGTPKEIFKNGEELKSYGLELPYPAYIAEKLRQKGLKIDGTILTEEDLAERLAALCE